MHETLIFEQENNHNIYILPTYLPYFFSERYRKQTIFSGPNSQEFLENFSFGSMILMAMTLELRKILQNIWRRFIGYVIITFLQVFAIFGYWVEVFSFVSKCLIARTLCTATGLVEVVRYCQTLLGVDVSVRDLARTHPSCLSFG